MSEHVCGGRVFYLTAKKKKRGIKGSGSLARVGRETSLRESFRYSKQGQDLYSHLLFKALSPKQRTALTFVPAHRLVMGAG